MKVEISMRFTGEDLEVRSKWLRENPPDVSSGALPKKEIVTTTGRVYFSLNGKIRGTVKSIATNAAAVVEVDPVYGEGELLVFPSSFLQNPEHVQDVVAVGDTLGLKLRWGIGSCEQYLPIRAWKVMENITESPEQKKGVSFDTMSRGKAVPVSTGAEGITIGTGPVRKESDDNLSSVQFPSLVRTLKPRESFGTVISLNEELDTATVSVEDGYGSDQYSAVKVSLDTCFKGQHRPPKRIKEVLAVGDTVSLVLSLKHNNVHVLVVRKEMGYVRLPSGMIMAPGHLRKDQRNLALKLHGSSKETILRHHPPPKPSEHGMDEATGLDLGKAVKDLSLTEASMREESCSAEKLKKSLTRAEKLNILETLGKALFPDSDRVQEALAVPGPSGIGTKKQKQEQEPAQFSKGKDTSPLEKIKIPPTKREKKTIWPVLGKNMPPDSAKVQGKTAAIPGTKFSGEKQKKSPTKKSIEYL